MKNIIIAKCTKNNNIYSALLELINNYSLYLDCKEYREVYAEIENYYKGKNQDANKN